MAYSLDELRAAAAKNGGECLAMEPVAARKLAPWRCSAGHEWRAQSHSVVRKGTWCRTCRVPKYATADERAEARRESSRRYSKLNPEARRAARRQWAENHADVVLHHMLKARYGIGLGQYEAMLGAQGGKCAICGSTEAGGRGRWHVDHDHETGKVRGLLCHMCNAGLGMFRDAPELLKRAIDYLRTNGKTDADAAA